MRKYLIGALLAGAASLFAAGPALAKGDGDLSFFTAGGATAAWSAHKAQVVFNEPADPSAYAGATLKGIGTVVPATAPSFTVTSNTPEASGGSPRLVIQFTDGSSIDGYYLTMNDTNPADMQWDSNGGTSGYLYNAGYDTALADHSDQTVASAYLVTDSGWEGTAYTNNITSLVYADKSFLH